MRTNVKKINVEINLYNIILLSVIINIMTATIIYADDNIQPPEVNAQGAILMDLDTGRVLWEKNSKEPMAMASTTKIMTAIIALEEGNLDDIVTVSKRAASAPKVNMSLREGEQIYLRDLMYALMLQSSNDAAVAIAEHVGKSVEQFCERMTQKAKEIGATDTVFRTPNGLDKDDHHSTAKDMAMIACYALKNKTFIDIINTGSVTTTSNEKNFRSHQITNKNRLLSEYSGALGVKTGFTGKAGQCFVGAAKRNDMTLISVVFASGWGTAGKEQKWIDTKRILDYGFNNYKYYELAKPNIVAKKVNVLRAKENDVDLITDSGFVIPLNKDEINKIRQVMQAPDEVEAPVKQGETYGKISLFLGDELLKEINLKSAAPIGRKNFNDYMQDIFTEWINLQYKNPLAS